MSNPHQASSSRELVDDIVELAKITAPTFSEEARLVWLERRLDRLAGTRRRDSVGNLIWTFGDGNPKVLVTAHVDTVFASDVPLAVTRVDSRLCGPGVGDNAAAIATVIRVVEDLAADGETDGVAVAFTIGEEGLGNLRGAYAACDELKPAAVIALEGHGLDQVFVDAIGSVRARVVLRGPGGHSWVDRELPSAVHELLRLGSELVRQGTPPAPVNVGVVSGGRSVNALADEAWLLVERRSLDDEPLGSFLDELGRLAVAPPLTVSVEETARRPCGRLPRDARLLQVVRDARRELELPNALVPASTDANAALDRGIPALALGVARGSGMHTLAEEIELDSLDMGRRQLELVLRRLLA
jgi:acetylornithine deacetylase/succinyl-diaminopimelate desuccinylase-like protein